MVNSHGSGPSLNTYQLRLPTFEGPLDLLLRLIEREQLPISEVSLLSVLDQFLAFVHELENFPPEAIADFVSVAGRLSVLKSRALLPRPVRVPDEIDEIDLVRQLQEYKALKTAAQLLAARQQTNGSGFEKGDGIACPPSSPKQLLPQAPAVLTRAVARWLTRLPPARVHVSAPRVVSLREMIFRIITTLEGRQTVLFDSIRGDCASRQDIAVAFLGVLTLLRRQAIQVTQPELFGPISIVRIRREPGSASESSPDLLANGSLHEAHRL